MGFIHAVPNGTASKMGISTQALKRLPIITSSRWDDQREGAKRKQHGSAGYVRRTISSAVGTILLSLEGKPVAEGRDRLSPGNLPLVFRA